MPVIKQITLHPKQGEVFKSQERFIIAIAGNQGGKTTIGAVWSYDKIQKYPKENGLIVAPVYDTLKHSTLEKFFSIFPQLKKYYLKKENIIYLPTGGKIFCRSADKEEHLEGLTLKWIWGDEADGFSYNTFLILQSRITTTSGFMLLTSSLYAKSWLANFLVNPPPGFKIVTWSSCENPFFPKKEYERLKQTLDPVIFERMYDAKPSFLTGLVYSNFKKENIIEPSFKTFPYYIAGIDFGIYDPTAVCVIGVDKKRGYFVESELYKPSVGISEIVDFLKKYEPKEVYLDPSQKTVALELKRFFPVYDLKERDVLSSIYVVRSIIHLNLLKVSRRCINFIREIFSYSFKKSSLFFTEEPEDKNNHLMDAMRYALSSHYLSHPNYFNNSLDKEEEGDIKLSSWFWERKKERRKLQEKENLLWKIYF